MRFDMPQVFLRHHRCEVWMTRAEFYRWLPHAVSAGQGGKGRFLVESDGASRSFAGKRWRVVLAELPEWVVEPKVRFLRLRVDLTLQGAWEEDEAEAFVQHFQRHYQRGGC